MEKKTYFCDKCNREVNKDKLMKFVLELRPPYKWSDRNHTFHSKDICVECCEELGVLKKAVVNDESTFEIKEKTTAEKLYDIIAEITWENQNQ